MHGHRPTNRPTPRSHHAPDVPTVTPASANRDACSTAHDGRLGLAAPRLPKGGPRNTHATRHRPLNQSTLTVGKGQSLSVGLTAEKAHESEWASRLWEGSEQHSGYFNTLAGTQGRWGFGPGHGTTPASGTGQGE